MSIVCLPDFMFSSGYILVSFEETQNYEIEIYRSFSADAAASILL